MSELSEDIIQRLISEARKARENAYAPYSNYKVGAALLVESKQIGRQIFLGCNVENETYSPTLCAERVAAGAAIAGGAEPGSFVAVAVVGGRADPSQKGEGRREKGEDSPQTLPLSTQHSGFSGRAQFIPLGSLSLSTPPQPPSPCGLCRQVLYELSGGEMLVVSVLPGGEERKVWEIRELLPDAFSGQV